MPKKKKITDRKRTFIFINILITCIASSLLATALTTALYPITKDFGISLTTGQWLTSGYSLTMGIIMPLTAFLITKFPTKNLYLTGLSVFTAGLFVCMISPNFQIMMAGRILQACGAGILTAMAQVVLLTIYPIEKKGTIMGWYGLAVGAAPVVAPTLSGVLVDTVGWKAIFYITFVIMIISLIFAVLVFDNVLDNFEKKFDLFSFAVSIFAFGGITLGIGNAGSHGFASLTVIIPLVVGGITAILFVWRQLHVEQPFLDLRVLKYRDFSLSLIGSMLLYLVMMGSSVIMPLYVQSLMGYSATISGLVTLPGSLAMAIVSPLAGKIFDRIGMKILFIAGAAFMLLSNIGMALLTIHTPIILSGVYNLMRCVAIGCIMMPIITWGTSRVDEAMLADATALLSSLRTIAGAVGAAVFVGVMTSVAKHSAEAYGKSAGIHGLNTAFLFISIGSLVLLVLAVFFVQPGKSKNIYSN